MDSGLDAVASPRNDDRESIAARSSFKQLHVAKPSHRE